MIKLLISTPVNFDSTSFYRCYGIIHNLNRQMKGRLQFDDFRNATYNWSNIMGYDIMYFHRPSTPAALQIIAYAKQIGVKIWVDYDDNLFNLPPESRAFDNFTLDVKKTMRAILETSDIITVSTQSLADFFTNSLAVETKCIVVPNALNDDIFKMSDSFHVNRNYVWRGSETHWKDLVEYGHEIFQAMNSNKHQWHFMGYRPATILEFFSSDRLICHPPQDPIHYHASLKALKPSIMHVPLSKNALNDSKSNIAWIEGTFAGAVCIAPDNQEWKKPGVITYKDFDEYKFNLITPPENLGELWKASRDYIQENLLLSTVNKQRIEIIETLMN